MSEELQITHIPEGEPLFSVEGVMLAADAVKLREANALIDTLVEALDCAVQGIERQLLHHCSIDGSKISEKDKFTILSLIAVNMNQALAEAKKWKGEV